MLLAFRFAARRTYAFFRRQFIDKLNADTVGTYAVGRDENDAPVSWR